jgi:hypothetical protein
MNYKGGPIMLVGKKLRYAKKSTKLRSLFTLFLSCYEVKFYGQVAPSYRLYAKREYLHTRIISSAVAFIEVYP